MSFARQVINKTCRSRRIGIDLLELAVEALRADTLAGGPALFVATPWAEDGKLDARLPDGAKKADAVIFLFMAGGPSQFETFDYKPRLKELYGSDLPDSIRKGQRLRPFGVHWGGDKI